MDHLPRPDDQLRELALFAGAGGGILGGILLGWRTVCAVEIDRDYFASAVDRIRRELAQGQLFTPAELAPRPPDQLTFPT